MAEMNTVCISGVLTRDVETHSRQGLQVARFFIDVAWAGHLAASFLGCGP
jgi:single-stranded DNA-binding protein